MENVADFPTGHKMTFAEAIAHVAALAHLRLPQDMHSRLEMATALVTQDGVFPEDDGHTYAVRGSEGRSYRVNGLCQCADFVERGTEWCKHKLAAALYKRASVLLVEQAAAPKEATTIPPQFVTEIRGKKFVKYAGLLAMAHAKGVVCLSAKFVTVTETMALAEATVVFEEGGSWTEAADSTPENVPAKMKEHWPRFALTRAKARALRDALNIGMVADIELECGEEVSA